MLKTGKLWSLAVVASTFIGLSGPSNAADRYAGLSAGQATVKDFCDGLSGDLCDDKAWTGRLYAGGFFDKYLAFEGGYRYVADSSIEISDPTLGQLALDASYHMFDGSLLVFTPEYSNVRLFLKVGAQYWRQTLDASVSTAGFSGSDSDTSNGVSLRTGVGATLGITERFGVRVAWDYIKDVGDNRGTDLKNFKSDMQVFSIGPEIRF